MHKSVLFFLSLIFCTLFFPLVTNAATATYNWADQNNTHWMTLRYTTDGGSGEAWERLYPTATGNKVLVSYDQSTSNTNVAVFEVPLSALRALLPAGYSITGANLVLTTAAADATAQGALATIYHSDLNPSEEVDDQTLYAALDNHQLVAQVEGPSFDPTTQYEIGIPTISDGIASTIDEVLADENINYYTIAILFEPFSGQTTNEINATLGASLNIIYDPPAPTVSSLAVSTTSINIASAGSFFYATTTFDMAMGTTTAPTLTFSPNVVSSGTLTFSSGTWSSGDTVYAARYTIANVGEEKTGVDIAVSGAVASVGNGGATMTATTSADRFNVDTIAPATPSASPDAGTYSSAQSVTLSSTGSNTIRYTTDGTTPTCSTGTLYSGAISVSSSLTIKALGCDTAGNTPALATLAYTIDSSSGVSGSSGGHRSFSSDASNNGDAAGDDQQDSGDPVAFNDAGEPLGESGVLELVPGESPVRVPVTELLNTPTVRLTLEEVVRKVLMLITLFLNIKL